VLVLDSSTEDGLLAANNTIAGNWIGTDRSGALDLGNETAGILLNAARNSVVGGGVTSAANRIAFNSVGVSVIGASVGNAIRRNSFYSNLGLGIDLGGDGVTANDAGDTDNGANNLQNHADLTSAGAGAGRDACARATGKFGEHQF
jgi:hypothetical protein